MKSSRSSRSSRPNSPALSWLATRLRLVVVEEEVATSTETEQKREQAKKHCTGPGHASKYQPQHTQSGLERRGHTWCPVDRLGVAGTSRGSSSLSPLICLPCLVVLAAASPSAVVPACAFTSSHRIAFVPPSSSQLAPPSRTQVSAPAARDAHTLGPAAAQQPRLTDCPLLACVQTNPTQRAAAAAAAMETYTPRTLEQMHAIQSKAAAAKAASSSQGLGAAAAVAAAKIAASKNKRKANAAAAARADGRQHTQLRSTFLQVGVVSAAVGSAYVERQGTKVLCAIYGPRASAKLSTPFSERGAFVCDVKFAPFAGGARRARRGAQATDEEKRLQLLVTEAVTVSIHLEAFPKAVLEAFVVILQEDGGVLPAAVSCVSLALADAGIMLYDLVTACQALSLDGALLLDPSATEEESWTAAVSESAEQEDDDEVESKDATPPAASVLLAYMPSLRQISSITQAGSSTTQQVTKLTHMCIAGCEQLNGLMRDCLVEAAKKKLTTATSAR